MYTCMCNWVTSLCSRKLTEYCKPAIIETIEIIMKNFLILKREREREMKNQRLSRDCELKGGKHQKRDPKNQLLLCKSYENEKINYILR